MASFLFSGLLLLVLSSVQPATAISRHDFPPGFTFGAGASAYQVEGAVAEDGRKPSIWDPFTQKGLTIDGKSADIASDQYHKYKEDVKLMHQIGLDAYRFSISWPRLIPDGRGEVNLKGLQYYNNFINELLIYGIEPHVTLYHFDLPLALQNAYDGELSPQFIEDFTAYADVCFREFGDRVKHWVTVNEPNIETTSGYDQGIMPPMRCSYPFGFLNCTAGDSTTEPYIAAHHLLLAHASAVALYRKKYQAEQGGRIGLTLLGWWYEPASDSPEDIAAARRMLEFHIGWFMNPLVHGNYPAVMRKNAGSRLPSLTEDETKRVRGSFDFIGFNHYIVIYVKANLSQLEEKVRDYYADAAVSLQFPFLILRKGMQSSNRGLRISFSPWSMRKMLDHIKVHYGNPPVVIHENGFGTFPGLQNEYYDQSRADFLQDYMGAVLDSIRNGSNVRGYFVWSLIDCFEFVFGYTAQFGLIGVDFSSENRTRYPRYSAHWYSSFLGGSKLMISSRNVDPHSSA